MGINRKIGSHLCFYKGSRTPSFAGADLQICAECYGGQSNDAKVKITGSPFKGG